MQSVYKYNISGPTLETLGYVIAIANIHDKHDRSTPSDFHWKVLKCRMIIFSNSSILASPDKKDVKQVHIIFNKVGDDYDKLNSLFLKYSLVQDGVIRRANSDVFQMCFQYTMTAKIAPIWNTLGYNYLINNRDFLTANGPQEGVKYSVICDEHNIKLELKPVKIHLNRADDDFMPCERVRVLPSLNNAIVEGCSQELPEGTFKSYKDLRRHWKNIHGYRLPDEEHPYYMIRFWRGEALTYPKLCLTRNFPIITPMPKSEEKKVLLQFLGCLQNKFTQILRKPLIILNSENLRTQEVKENFNDTQAISLCTPTQYSSR